MEWLVAWYLPASLFSLRASTATTSGARTNLVPTMYAVKLALVDAAFRAGGDGRQVFDVVKALPIRFLPPPRAVVSNTFVKVQREPKERREGVAFIPSVGYREFCYLDGELAVAFGISRLEEEAIGLLRNCLPLVNYFGKRGSFFQFLRVSEVAELGPGYGYVASDDRAFSAEVIIQYLDDLGLGTTFEQVSTYSEASMRVGRDRVLVPVALPYRRAASSRGYTLYERTV